jgi:hypothetical protein
MSEQTDAAQPSGRRRRWRLAVVIALLAALIPAIPIVIGVAISSAKPGAAKATANTFDPTPSAPSSNPRTTSTPTPHPPSAARRADGAGPARHHDA